jgi:hypothetical protein
VDNVTDTVVNSIEAEAKRVALEYIKDRIYSSTDMHKLVREVVSNEIMLRLKDFNFPSRSIPGSAIDPVGLEITGGNLTGGVIKNFNSSGIEDKSSEIQMTLLDEAVVIENRLVTLGLEVQGDSVFAGNIRIDGDVDPSSGFYQSVVQHSAASLKDSLTTELFQRYSHVLFELIKEKGLDLDVITIDGRPVIAGNGIGNHITQSNLQKLGILQGLRTQGETLLSDTLYVSGDRVGINTQEPGHALSIWDQDVEVAVGRHSKGQAWLGTPRDQGMVLGCKNNDNIVLGTDGSVSVQKLKVEGVDIGTSRTPPSHVAPPGSLMLNSAPSMGSAAGWVSLGGGTWARFGTLS